MPSNPNNPIRINVLDSDDIASGETSPNTWDNFDQEVSAQNQANKDIASQKARIAEIKAKLAELNASDAERNARLEKLNKQVAGYEAYMAEQRAKYATLENNPEQSTPEQQKITTEKGKGNKAFKRALAVAGAAVLATGLLIGGIFIGKNNPNNAPTNPSSPTQTESIQENNETEKNWNDLTGYEALDETIDGSFLQYDNIGCYNSEGKVTPTSVGNPRLVLEAMGVNPDEATAEQRGTVQEYYAYCMEEVAASVAIGGLFPGFAGLSQLEGEQKIHNMKPEEKLELQAQLKQYFNTTSFEYITGNGVYRNQSIIENKGAEDEKHSEFTEFDLTGKEMIKGTTVLAEDMAITIGGETTVLPAGTTMEWVSKEDCGNPENQVHVTKPDLSVTIVVIPEKPTTEEPDNPDTPSPEPTPTPTPTPTPETHPPKDEEKEKEYAGEGSDPMSVDPSKANTEAEHEAQEKENRDSVAEQAAADAAAAEAAQATADAQAAAEATAAQSVAGQPSGIGGLTQEEVDALHDQYVAESQATDTQAAANEVTNKSQAEAAQAEAAQAAAEAAATETINQGVPSQAEAENGTLDGDDFADIAAQFFN